MGHALENAVYTELLRRDHAPNYEITRNGYEIDFVVKLRDGRRLAIQVCVDPDDPVTLAREIRALSDTEPDTTLLLLTSFTEDDVEDSGRSIRMVPVWKWFLRKWYPFMSGKTAQRTVHERVTSFFATETT